MKLKTPRLVTGLCCFIALIGSIQCAFAQDTLYMKDGQRRIIKRLEIHSTEITYSLFADSLELTHHLSTGSVLKIVFLDGSVKTFIPTTIPLGIDSSRNSLSLNLISSAFLRTLSCNYERFSRNGKTSVKFLVGIGYNVKTNIVDIIDDETPNWAVVNMFHGYKYHVGSSFYFYPKGYFRKKGIIKFLIGPSVEVAAANVNLEDLTLTYKGTVTLAIMRVDFGFRCNLGKKGFISLMAGVGAQNLSGDAIGPWKPSGIYSSGSFEFAAGTRF